jgi:carbonic anhydrase/acetyltransferase-like protein (isoleucine patch superfamily)
MEVDVNVLWHHDAIVFELCLSRKTPAMPFFQLGQERPKAHPSVFLAPGAVVVGRVELHANSSVWFNASLRGDNDLIVLGEGSNIQEGSVLHTDTGHPLTIGRHVTVGHQAMLHGCTIGDESLIGMQAIVLNGAKIGSHCIIGAGALVTGNAVIPNGSMVLGSPAKVVRPLKPEEIEMIQRAAAGYIDRAKLFGSELIALDGTEGMSRPV